VHRRSARPLQPPVYCTATMTMSPAGVAQNVPTVARVADLVNKRLRLGDVAAHELDGVALLRRPGVPMAAAMLPEPMMLMMVMPCVPPLCLGHLAVMVVLA
jgi:hypothetical protein